MSPPKITYSIDFSDREISSESTMVDIFKELSSSGLIGGEIMSVTCYVSVESLLKMTNFCRFDGFGSYLVGPYKLNIRIKRNDS